MSQALILLLLACLQLADYDWTHKFQTEAEPAPLIAPCNSTASPAAVSANAAIVHESRKLLTLRSCDRRFGALKNASSLSGTLRVATEVAYNLWRLPSRMRISQPPLQPSTAAAGRALEFDALQRTQAKSISRSKISCT